MPAWKPRRCEPSPQTARPQNGLPIPSKGRRTNGDTMDAAMAREARTAAFDNFENSPYTEANAMQNGDEEVGTRGGYGRRNLDGVDFSADDRRAEGKTPEKPAFSGTGSTDNGIPEDGGSRFGGETPEKVREINGRHYAYGQPDAADYTVPVRTAADYPALTKISFPFPYPPTTTGSGDFFFCGNAGACTVRGRKCREPSTRHVPGVLPQSWQEPIAKKRSPRDRVSCMSLFSRVRG